MIAECYEQEIDAEEEHDLVVAFGSKDTHDKQFPNCKQEHNWKDE